MRKSRNGLRPITYIHPLKGEIKGCLISLNSYNNLKNGIKTLLLMEEENGKIEQFSINNNVKFDDIENNEFRKSIKNLSDIKLQFMIKMLNKKYPNIKFQFKQQEDSLILLHNNKFLKNNHRFTNVIIDILYYVLPKELENKLIIKYYNFNK